MDDKKKKYVLDANSLIKFRDFLFTNYDCYITEGVIKEIKDDNSRKKLNNFLPLLKIGKAEENDINFVKHFAKLTGDYDSLSEVDIEVIALTYMLHRKYGDVSKLCATPMETIYKYEDVEYEYTTYNNKRCNKKKKYTKKRSAECEESNSQPGGNASENASENAEEAEMGKDNTTCFCTNFERDEGGTELKREDDNAAKAQECIGVEEAICVAEKGETEIGVVEGGERVKLLDEERDNMNDENRDNGKNYDQDVSYDREGIDDQEMNIGDVSNRESGDDVSNRESGDDVSNRGSDDDVSNRGSDDDVSNRDSGDDVNNRDSGDNVRKRGGKILGCETIREEVVEVTRGKEDDEGWVNVNNFETINLHVDRSKQFETDIACVTTDYAMQNVLYQIGLHVITIDGYKINSVKLWGYICTSCYFFMRKNSLLFCSKCGNNNLRKVNVLVDNQLKKLVVKIPQFRVNCKNTIFSIPKKKKNLKNKFEEKLQIFREDELLIGGRKQYLTHQKKLYESQKNLKDPFKEDDLYDYVNDWTYRTTLKSGKVAILRNPKIVVGGRRNIHRKRR
ncbi:RNA-binding protein NOB1, putative [Plasmodium ovale]|uniref:RNA-binding protein NOB1, putative n=2 Tax=Plasmodium ovale TaxID=36330 RepID=A0A1A8VNS5_PLAOA|nr:RNA-binding protein NOB1, putative [Plasmodium ovale curtisi]SCA48702.1 RNA-binding protein NOB1, putative [Plasmodium ovale]